MATQTVATTKNGSQMPIPPGPNPNTGIGANSGIDPKRQAWLDQCTAFGEASGSGAASLVGWYQATVQAAYRDEIEPDFAVEGTKNYQKGKRQRAAMLGKRATMSDGKADKVRESECRKMIRVGKLAQFRNINNGGLGVFNRALKIIGDDIELKGELSKHLLKVMTEQLRCPDAPLDDDHIRQVLSPKESADKGEGEYLHQAKKLLELAAKASSWDAHKRAALTSVNARIEQIGFKTAAERRLEAMAVAKAKKDKAAAAARAKAEKKAAKAAK